jgi:bifunctional DNA-binding transcriptional regulator/antitoxin component of YhaV-PrlF toxin-antitoxin module
MSTSVLERGNMKIEKKRINVSSKRQITIPQKFYEKLGIGTEVECILKEDGIMIKPVQDGNSGYFAEQILKDLIDQGLSGGKLFEEFKAMNAKVRPAVRALIDEANKIARESRGSGDDETEEIFGE